MIAMIKPEYYDKQRQDTRYDPKTNKWISYRIDVQIAGRRYRNRFAKKSDAQAFIDNLRTQKRNRNAGIQTASSSTIRASEFFAAALKNIEREKEQIRAVRIFRIFTELHHDPFVNEIGKSHFLEYINHRKGMKPQTINREITILSSALNNAAQLFPRDLADYVPVIARAKMTKDKPYKYVISEAEKDGIVELLLNDTFGRKNGVRARSRIGFAKMFEFAWLLGLRMSECLNLKRSDYNDLTETLTVVRGKTNSVTPLKFLPERALEIIKEKRGDEPIFDIYCSDVIMSKMLKRACEPLGIPYGRGKGFTFHGTRHSFTTRLVKVTDIATAASFTGHSDKEMVAYYSHASDESQKAAMEALYGRTGLREIYEKVRSGTMNFDDFRAAIKAVKI